MSMPRVVLLLVFAALSTVACVSRSHPSGHMAPPRPAALVWPADLVLADSTDVKPVKHVFPTYPSAYESEGREAKLVAVYVLDTAGVVDLGSVRFLLEAPRAFASAIGDALRKERFVPLRRDGRLHPALVADAFGFFSGEPDEREDGNARWLRERPNVEALRQEIRRRGLTDVHRELAARPGCS
ncbi:MAG: hypothetical protein ACJ79K_13495 [Gemmatimonadaceae bacterium]